MRNFIKPLAIITLILLNSSVYSQDFLAVQSGDWNDGATWGNTSPGTVGTDFPGAGDDVQLPELSSNYIVTIPSGYTANCANLDIGDDGFSDTTSVQLRVGVSGVGGGTLNISGDVQFLIGSLTNCLLQTRHTDAVINVAGSFNFSGDGTEDRLIMSAGGTLNLSGGFTVDGRVTSGTKGIINFQSSTEAQTIRVDGTNYDYNTIRCNNTHASGVSLAGNLVSTNFVGNLEVQSGELDNGGFSITGASTDTFTVSNGATFKLTGTSAMPTVMVHSLGSSSTIEYGGGSQTITLPLNSQDYGNLTISGTGTKSLSAEGNRNVVGILTVSASTLALGTGSDGITLVSNASGTAGLANVTGTITGTQLTVQRYLTDANGWRTLACPIPGHEINDWDDSISTSGFTGADGTAGSFVSIYTYDEDSLGLSSAGWVTPTDSSDALTEGAGFAVYVLETGGVTLSVTGAPSTGSESPTVTYTSDSGVNEDGWNLVGNPFCSKIDWGAGTMTKTNMDDMYWILDPASGNYGCWDEGMSSGTLGANGNIESGQGFWVHTTAASPVLTIPQTAKTAAAAGSLFKQTNNHLKLTFSSSINTFYDEALIFSDANGTSAFDSYDALKVFTINPWEVPSLSVLTSDDKDLVIATVEDAVAAGDTLSIPLRTTVGISGTYDLDITGFTNFPLSSSTFIVLEDLENGNITTVNGDSLSYSFTIQNTTQAPRFLLHMVSTIPVGVEEEIGEKGLSVYPNPFKSQTTFSFNEEYEGQMSLVLMNQLGSKVMERVIAPGTKEYVLQRNDLPTGIYFYELNSNQTTLSSGKLIID